MPLSRRSRQSGWFATTAFTPNAFGNGSRMALGKAIPSSAPCADARSQFVWRRCECGKLPVVATRCQQEIKCRRAPYSKLAGWFE
mmetsp:Transcript_13501/g.32050  ORF Transcript_13501/g.32050 Transcript_13501/m.32050 type:complete len:85 (-) Transcript_13501:29-283(-)